VGAKLTLETLATKYHETAFSKSESPSFTVSSNFVVHSYLNIVGVIDSGVTMEGSTASATAVALLGESGNFRKNERGVGLQYDRMDMKFGVKHHKANVRLESRRPENDGRRRGG